MSAISAINTPHSFRGSFLDDKLVSSSTTTTSPPPSPQRNWWNYTAAATTTTPTKNRTKSRIILTETSSGTIQVLPGVPQGKGKNQQTTTNHFVAPKTIELNQAAYAIVVPAASAAVAVRATPVGNAMFDTCQAHLVGPVSQIQQQHVHQGQPILHSMVPVDGAYRLIFITEHIKHLYQSWTCTATNNYHDCNWTAALWTCDGTPALLHPNQHENDVGEGGTFVLTCPLTVQMVTGIQGCDHGQGSTIPRHHCGRVEYNTSVWRNCADHNPLQGIPINSTNKVVCTMISGHHWELTQWIEYHRVVGFEHFLIYLNEPYEPDTLPNATDITYIPWNFARVGEKGAMPHQAVQQMDCIQRAQARNVTWLALHDVDEYFQIMMDHNHKNNNDSGADDVGRDPQIARNGSKHGRVTNSVLVLW